MGYLSTFADQMVAEKSARKAGGIFANPAVGASVLVVTAAATFFAVKGIVNSNPMNGMQPETQAVVSLTEIDTSSESTAETTLLPEITTTAATTTTTTTTTTKATTTTTAAPTTTTTAAATTTTTEPPVYVEIQFQRAKLLYPAAYPDVSIPGITLPEKYGDGLLDPEAVFWIINELREQKGLKPFERGNSQLGNAAQIRADELLVSFSQTRPDGTGYATAIKECGVEYKYTMESVGYGQYTAEQLVSDWMKSDENMKNMMNATCNRVCITCVVGEDNIPVWVMEGIC